MKLDLTRFKQNFAACAANKGLRILNGINSLRQLSREYFVQKTPIDEALLAPDIRPKGYRMTDIVMATSPKTGDKILCRVIGVNQESGSVIVRPYADSTSVNKFEIKHEDNIRHAGTFERAHITRTSRDPEPRQ